VHSRLTVSTLIFRNTTIEVIGDSCAKAGIDRVGLSSAVLERDSVAHIAEVQRKHQIDVTHFAVKDLVTTESEVSESAQISLDAASELGARFIYGLTGPAVPLEWDDAASRFQDAVKPLKEEADRVGLPILIESTSGVMTSDVSFIHNVRDAVDLVEMADIGLCFDINHSWSERHLADTIKRAGSRLRNVQISDMILGRRDRFRAAPGDGVIPLARILGWVLETGYSGLFDIEVSPEPGVEPDVTLARAVEQSEALLSEVGL
jgi:sugar phosphate isomerase/epimerase